MAASTSEIVYRDFGRDAEVSVQRSLYAKAFPEQRGAFAGTETEPHYVWKFRRFPAEPPSYEYAAYANDEIVGYYGAIPFRYRLGGIERTCGMVCDVMTHPGFQGRGIFTNLGRYSLEQMRTRRVDITTGFPIRPAVIPGHLKVGWKIAFDLPMYLRPLRSSAILKSKGLGFAAPIIDPVLRLLNLCASLKRKSDGYSVKTHLESTFARANEIEAFLQRVAEQVPNYLRKDTAFYEWRLGAPTLNYTALELRRSDECVGLAIVRRTDLHDIPVLAILDMMVLAGSEKGLSALHSAIVSLAEESTVEAVVTMMSSTRARQFQLRRRFFLKTPFVFKFIINRLNPVLDEASLLQEGNWHLMWIDSDDL
jgi:GNAT superfamily N-acetyltransferase